ncbi:hypothetical protein DUI87_14276 [Hirundo rustica rustica]|uniref:Uncharacterized protein n=1 Tax=Hirundo rustica rustica TaxID=333673 RepID=A0A3M0K7W7_HIRRU|nr:hypothetical protein DUI87_14276 [Hirundo rustica rustica]
MRYSGCFSQSAGTSGQAFIATVSDMKQMTQQLVPKRTTNADQDISLGSGSADLDDRGVEVERRDAAGTLGEVLLLACAEDLGCVPGFQQKVFYIEKPFEFTEDQLVLNREASTAIVSSSPTFDVMFHTTSHLCSKVMLDANKDYGA